MEHIAFIRKLEPTRVEVAGVEVCLSFTMHAAARMEEALGRPYAEIVEEILQFPGEDGAPVPPMAIERQLAVVRILMEEAGQSVEPEELRRLHMLEFAHLCRAAQHEMLYKGTMDGAKKNRMPQKSLSAG